MARRTPLVPFLFLALAPLVILALAGPAGAQAPKRGGTLRIAEREAPSLDPHLSISFFTHSHMNMVYSQLVRVPHGPEQKHSTGFSIVPDLAERWEYTNPTTLVFYLPFAPILNHLANPTYTAILPREAEEKFKDFNHPDAVIGTGPFALTTYYRKGVQAVHRPAVKGFKHHDGHGMGLRLMYTWLDK